MIHVDANLLLYAANRGAPEHERARAWLDKRLKGTVGVGLPYGRYTVMVVSRRIASLLVAVLMIAAPVSAEICDATCAGHLHADAQAASDSTHGHHVSTVHHGSAYQQRESTGTQAGPSRAELCAPARSCGHGEATIVSTLNDRAPTTHASVAVWIFVGLGDASLRSRVPPLSEAHSPPGPIRSITLLRI